MKRYVVVMTLLAGLVASNVAFGFAIRGYVIGNGGHSSPPASNGIHQLYGTATGKIVASDAESIRLARRWITWDSFRVALIAVGFIASVRAISLPAATKV